MDFRRAHDSTKKIKMVIKPFKVAPKVPENFFFEAWKHLKDALDAVYSKSSTFISKEELYRVGSAQIVFTSNIFALRCLFSFLFNCVLLYRL
jgi:hypothetical protein